MLDRVTKAIFLIILATLLGCNRPPDQDLKSIEKTVSPQIPAAEYFEIQCLAFDSLEMWKANEIFGSKDTMYTTLTLDSLLCFNTAGDRFVGCIHNTHTGKNRSASSDGLTFFYGEKIKGAWYFFTGGFVVIPRRMIEEHNLSIPLSYFELHKIALNEIYSGYLDVQGSINEQWFKKQFENVGMCAECKTREDFQKNILAGVAAQWANRDTTQAIKRLDKTSQPIP